MSSDEWKQSGSESEQNSPSYGGHKATIVNVNMWWLRQAASHCVSLLLLYKFIISVFNGWLSSVIKLIVCILHTFQYLEVLFVSRRTSVSL